MSDELIVLGDDYEEAELFDNDYNYEETVDDKWYFEVESEEYGIEEFGGYDTEVLAEAGLKRVKDAARKLRDGVRRTYSDTYQGSRHKDYV